MRKILTSFSLVVASLTFAQVGINAEQNDIADDAVFHVRNKSAESKGVILPSVSLTAVDDQTTITGASGDVTDGLLVWNDGKSALKPAGYYYWDGAKWTLTGNVDSSVPEKTLRSVPAITLTEWDNNQYGLVQTGTGAIQLPDPTLNVNRIIVVSNDTNTTLNYGVPSPVRNSTIRAGKGQTLMSDGSHWYIIGGF